MTREEYISDLADAIRTAVPSNVTLSGSTVASALNATVATMYTVDPTKKPTIKHITDLEFS